MVTPADVYDASFVMLLLESPQSLLRQQRVFLLLFDYLMRPFLTIALLRWLCSRLGVLMLLLLLWVLLLLLLGRCLLCFVWHSGLLGHGYKNFRGQTMSLLSRLARRQDSRNFNKSAAAIQSYESLKVLSVTLSAADTGLRRGTHLPDDPAIRSP
jgi:hypothetical protein